MAALLIAATNMPMKIAGAFLEHHVKGDGIGHVVGSNCQI